MEEERERGEGRPLDSLRGFRELDANIRDQEEVHQSLDCSVQVDGKRVLELADQPIKIVPELFIADGGTRAEKESVSGMSQTGIIFPFIPDDSS